MGHDQENNEVMIDARNQTPWKTKGVVSEAAPKEQNDVHVSVRR